MDSTELEIICLLIKEINKKKIDRHFSRLQPSFFKDVVYREIYTYCLNFFRKYNSLPSESDVANKFQVNLKITPSNTIEFLIDKLCERKIFDGLKEVAQNIADNLNAGNAKDLLETIPKKIKELNNASISTKAKSIDQYYEEIVANYEKRKNKDYGILSPWPSLNNLVTGFNAGDFILFAARAGTGKTFLTIQLIKKMVQSRKRVLYISPEMSFISIANRSASIFLDINYKNIRKAELNEYEENRLKDFFRDAQNEHREYLKIITDDFSFDMEDLEREIEEYQADCLIIDGVYLLKTKRQGDRFAKASFVSEEIKRVAKSYKIPVIGTTQLNREAINLTIDELHQGHIVLSDSFGWIIDYGFIVARDTIHKEHKVMVLKPIKAREADFSSNIIVNWDFEENNFTENLSFEETIKKDKEAKAKAKEKSKQFNSMYNPASYV